MSLLKYVLCGPTNDVFEALQPYLKAHEIPIAHSVASRFSNSSLTRALFTSSQ